MLISFRGTTGSGKSIAAYKVLQALGGMDAWQPYYREKRLKPIYYRWKPNPVLIVPGHYETACGGCDGLGPCPAIYKVITAIEWETALTEGLLWSEDVKWTLQLRHKNPHAFFFTTNLDECLKRLYQRRAGRVPRDVERIKMKLTRRVKTIDSARRRLSEAGVPCRRCSADQAPYYALKLLEPFTAEYIKPKQQLANLERYLAKSGYSA